jgi:hypothetical protein
MCTPFNKKNKVYPLALPIVCGTKRMTTILHTPITDYKEGLEYIHLNKSDQNKILHHISIQEKKNNL